MNLFKRWFGKKDVANAVEKSPFTVEFYPITKRYYPKYKHYYLKRCYSTGVVRTETMFAIANYSETEKGAEEIIALFKEHSFKENVTIIQK